MERFLTTDELAVALRTPPATIRYWRAVGRAPRATKLGRRVLYAESDVERWIADQNQDPDRETA